jgi:hypothetical protein
VRVECPRTLVDMCAPVRRALVERDRAWCEVVVEYCVTEEEGWLLTCYITEEISSAAPSSLRVSGNGQYTAAAFRHRTSWRSNKTLLRYGTDIILWLYNRADVANVGGDDGSRSVEGVAKDARSCWSASCVSCWEETHPVCLR